MALFSDSAPRTGSPLFTLAPGQVYLPPQGWYFVDPSQANTQKYDARAGIWRFAGNPGNNMDTSYFDGTSIRIANTSGCAIAAVVTTAGTGYTTAPTVTASAGASSWTALIGGAVSTTATILTAGSGYLYPPVLLIEQPAFQGVQAEGYTTIANGTISAVTITNQGAGYTLPPVVTLLNDWRDGAGYGGQVSVGLTGSGTVTAVLCTNHGNPITSGTVPTLSFGSGSAAATVVMDWSVTSVSITAAGAGYTSAAANVTAAGAGGFVSSAPAYVGTMDTTDLVAWREAKIGIATSAAGGLTTATIIDGGRYQSIPSPVIYSAQTYTTVGTLTFTMGGLSTTVFLSPAQQ